MNNTVMVENKIRQKLKLVCTLLCVFSLCFIAVTVCMSLIYKQNLNGPVQEHNVVLKEVYKASSNTLTCDENKYFNVVWDDETVNVNWNDYIGKNITIVTPQQTFGGSNPWVLGLIADGKTVVDYRDTLNEQRALNDEYKLIFGIVCGVVCAATCGAFIWRFNIKPLAEKTLYREFAEFLSTRQPVCPERKRMNIAIGVYAGVILIIAVIAAVLTDGESDTMTFTDIISASVIGGVTLLGGAAIIAFSQWVRRREIKFYAEKLPFDFSDISHMIMNKKVKKELQAEILKERELHPDSFADGGNGYDVEFTQDGVILKEPAADEDMPTPNVPDANDVFDYEKSASAAEPNTIINAPDTYKKVMTLTYEQLRFEAVAHYRKHVRPMMIIIKSRLERTSDFPEEFINDIHIAFDINLYNTIKKYNVPVENLEYLLENKERLMMENCFKNNKKKAKTAK